MSPGTASPRSATAESAPSAADVVEREHGGRAAPRASSPASRRSRSPRSCPISPGSAPHRAPPRSRRPGSPGGAGPTIHRAPQVGDALVTEGDQVLRGQPPADEVVVRGDVEPRQPGLAGAGENDRHGRRARAGPPPPSVVPTTTKPSTPRRSRVSTVTPADPPVHVAVGEDRLQPDRVQCRGETFEQGRRTRGCAGRAAAPRPVAVRDSDRLRATPVGLVAKLRHRLQDGAPADLADVRRASQDQRHQGLRDPGPCSATSRMVGAARAPAPSARSRRVSILSLRCTARCRHLCGPVHILSNSEGYTVIDRGGRRLTAGMVGGGAAPTSARPTARPCVSTTVRARRRRVRPRPRDVRARWPELGVPAARVYRDYREMADGGVRPRRRRRRRRGRHAERQPRRDRPRVPRAGGSRWSARSR